ncbi:MAG: bacterial Ig-like domain-containing protein [Clostridia bacterium]|nr:bacterial Ig-like domain-containing protein [Clostridia bacterium]
MKKFAFCLSFCLMFFGVFAFAGCGEGDLNIVSISITKDPTKVTYAVDETLDLSGGKFTAKRGNGTEVEFDLSVATPSVTRFDEAGTITITMTYAQKTSTFEVTVNPAMYQPKYNRTITATYNGQEQPVELFDSDSLLNGMSIISTTYIDSTNTALLSAPVEVGKYKVEVVVDGGVNYQDFTAIADYTITKADYSSLATQNYLDFVGISTLTYGTDFDLAKLWATDDTRTQLGEVPLASDFAQNITYSYKKAGATTSTAITPDGNGKVYANLGVGSYTITASASETSNLNAFSQSCQLQVMAKELVLGVDYDFIITTASGDVDYVAPVGDTINTLVTVNGANPDVTVTVQFYGNAQECASDYNLVIRYGNSINSTNTYTNDINEAGVYNLSLELASDSNYSYSDLTRNVIRVIIE